MVGLEAGVPAAPVGRVFAVLWDQLLDGTLLEATALTMRRASVGYAVAVVIGAVVGSLVARGHVLRVAFGSLITGLQTMPSITWFPLAILLFRLSESAILFVVVLGAAPAVANGLISGTDQIPPLLLRARPVLGARGLSAYRYVILPASLPAFVGRHLRALLDRRPDAERPLAERRRRLMASMVLILLIGIAIDAAIFSTLDPTIRRRWGLLDLR